MLLEFRRVLFRSHVRGCSGGRGVMVVLVVVVVVAVVVAVAVVRHQ